MCGTFAPPNKEEIHVLLKSIRYIYKNINGSNAGLQISVNQEATQKTTTEARLGLGENCKK